MVYGIILKLSERLGDNPFEYWYEYILILVASFMLSCVILDLKNKS
jgi:hypothetical protein